MIFFAQDDGGFAAGAPRELPIGTRVEDPTTLPCPRPPLLKRMCVRCELVIGWEVCAPACGGLVVRSVCVYCAAAEAEKGGAQ